MSRLSISLLGTLQLARGDAPLGTIESDKGRALLAYLAVEADRPHSRAALASLLWPDVPERVARQNLRRALDGAPGATPTLLVTPHHIQFNPAADYGLDVSAFGRLLDACQVHASRPKRPGPSWRH
jgi:DNA-binding SARP family transcriptional activator